MNIELKLNNSFLNITEGNDKHIEMAIEGFFGVCGHSFERLTNTQELPLKEFVATITEPVDQTSLVNGGDGAWHEGVAIPKNDIASKPKHSRQLPLVGATKTLSHKPFEVLGEQQAKSSDIRETEEGYKLYKSHYFCPQCGNEGNRYNRESNRYMKCHDCGTKITQEAATFETDELGVPLPDKGGNFFIGRDFYEIDNPFEEGEK